jgi:hypothetical protein
MMDFYSFEDVPRESVLPDQQASVDISAKEVNRGTGHSDHRREA